MIKVNSKKLKIKHTKSLNDTMTRKKTIRHSKVFPEQSRFLELLQSVINGDGENFFP